ncbi:hypothetical protein BJ138DRAFT_793084 [Hygrophoropsis aurantiaca]|uniref:Uncharacterized protein n=1 Tax=Hygrophoropsis aurantiaca TaxID=72124 RepID=A0ACB7ZVW0_9AGAM|nr:hypothetical protein BJ138DRAFT_793084 [Hygrophoropsis aurantiaca]
MPVCSVSYCHKSTSLRDVRPNGMPYKLCVGCREKWTSYAAKRAARLHAARKVKPERGRRVDGEEEGSDENENVEGDGDENEREDNEQDHNVDAKSDPELEPEPLQRSRSVQRSGSAGGSRSRLGSGPGSSTLIDSVINIDDSDDEYGPDVDAQVAALQERRRYLQQLVDAMMELKEIEEQLGIFRGTGARLQRQQSQQRRKRDTQGADDENKRTMKSSGREGASKSAGPSRKSAGASSKSANPIRTNVTQDDAQEEERPRKIQRLSMA